MKKSFLKRAMAAAIAVPVALTQTLVCATGFAAEDTAADTGAITLTIDSLTAVEADTTKNVPVEVERTEKSRTYVQESSWNKVLYGALGSVAATNPTFDLDAVAMAGVIESEAWYADLLKDALTNGGSAKVDVTAKDVTITANISYDFSKDIADVLEQKIPGSSMMIEAQPIVGTVTIKADTENLIDDTTVSARATIILDGKNMSAKDAIDYVQNKIAEVRTDAEASVAFDDALSADVAALFDSYESKLAKAEQKFEKAMTLSKSGNASGDSCNAILAQVKEKYAGNKFADKIPATVSEALSKNTVAAIFNEALRQINANMTDYKLDVTTDAVAVFAESLYDITVYGSVDAGNVEGEGSAKSADKISAADFEALFNYFVELEGDEVAVENFKTEIVYEATGEGSVNGLNGDADLTIERVITYDVVPVEETTTSTTETTETTDTTDTTDETETSTTETTDVDETETSTTETTDVDETETSTTETTDVDETETSTTETTDVDETETSTTETTDVDETETSTTETTDVDETETSTTETTDVDETETSTTETTDESETSTTETTDESETSTTETTDESETSTTETTDESETSTTETTETTETTAKTLTVTASAKASNFYFSHDTTVLTADMLIESAYVETFVDGVSQGVADAKDDIIFGLKGTEAVGNMTPEYIYNTWGEPYAALPVYAFYVDPTVEDAEPVLIDVDIKIYVGVKGDATLDGVADAKDAAQILMYAASFGAGNTNPVLYTEEYPEVENFAFFLGDVNTELKTENATELNAADAAKILQYSAWFGGLATAPSNGVIEAKWYELIPSLNA